MLMLDGKEHRSGLGFPCHYTVVLPERAVRGEASPLILCLHDLGESRETLLYEMGLGVLADELGVALLIPDGRRSCFLDMAHGPAWATFFAGEQVRRMQHDFRLRIDRMGVAGIGAGALGALQICRLTGATQFVCAAVDPAFEMVDRCDEAQWPRAQEWMGVFDNCADRWTPECFRGTEGCLIGAEDRVSGCAARFGLCGWEQQALAGTREEQWRRAVAWCAKRLKAEI